MVNDHSLPQNANLIFEQAGMVTYEERCRNLGQTGMVVWLTGLSGAGKSTIAIHLERKLVGQGYVAYCLDGDNLRLGINQDLGFSDGDRHENVRRMAEVAALFKDAGIITIVACISPFRQMRRFARERAGAAGFIEVFVKADLETCIRRDPKGLYLKTREGQVKNMTGVASPYEEPEQAELVLDTARKSIEDAVEAVFAAIVSRLGIDQSK